MSAETKTMNNETSKLQSNQDIADAINYNVKQVKESFKLQLFDAIEINKTINMTDIETSKALIIMATKYKLKEENLKKQIYYANMAMVISITNFFYETLGELLVKQRGLGGELGYKEFTNYFISNKPSLLEFKEKFTQHVLNQY